jgi:hypothetical protein
MAQKKLFNTVSKTDKEPVKKTDNLYTLLANSNLESSPSRQGMHSYNYRTGVIPNLTTETVLITPVDNRFGFATKVLTKADNKKEIILDVNIPATSFKTKQKPNGDFAYHQEFKKDFQLANLLILENKSE